MLMRIPCFISHFYTSLPARSRFSLFSTLSSSCPSIRQLQNSEEPLAGSSPPIPALYMWGD